MQGLASLRFCLQWQMRAFSGVWQERLHLVIY
ncbi:hypothetical protein BAE44_0019254 [Dichanthelium oligosanthes]|uniref:Uncharacterized protein n=1 Tax=Dichanthelium oligosanthes TaxID=888268 RepID=A0A1E5V3S2_9POAL|nr:hypothetical protein BAE44_0019254 [Dichanthelium oligosanthes]